MPGERSCSVLRACDAFDLRLEAIGVFTKLDPEPAAYDAPEVWPLLTRSVCAGNVVAIALDRLCPPIVASDVVAAKVGRAWVGQGICDRLTWAPDLLDDAIPA